MICYEFYERNKIGGDKLIGILPERRRDPERADLESILRWSRVVFGTSLDMNQIYFITVSLPESVRDLSFRREEILMVQPY